MNEHELKTALEHDAAARGAGSEVVRALVLAAECLRNAAVAARGAEAALIACRPPAVVEARQATQLAIASLEQAMMLMSMEPPVNE